MRVRALISSVLSGLALCAACLSAAASSGAQQQPPPTQQKPAAQTKQEPAPKVEPTPPPAAPAAKKNARPEGEAAPAPEPFEKMTPEQMAGHCVTLDTEAGEVVFELLPEAAPESVRNFLNLAAAGAFDTTTFSRVVKDFVVQGGNVTTREKVTPELLRRSARKVPDEPNEVKHVRGVVSLARPAEANSATSHFFILLNDSPHLDGTFAAFGRVTAGMDVVDKIAAGELDGEKPKSPVRIRRATVALCTPPAAQPKK
jgi:peptidyl-prolyl cis-trans isomerase B (cyclophilin B)